MGPHSLEDFVSEYVSILTSPSQEERRENYQTGVCHCVIGNVPLEIELAHLEFLWHVEFWSFESNTKISSDHTDDGNHDSKITDETAYLQVKDEFLFLFESY